MQETDAFAPAGMVAYNNGLKISARYLAIAAKERKVQMKSLARYDIITSGASRCFAMLRKRSALQVPPFRKHV